ncbi:hypothetical protein [Mycolicibacterium brumae]|uniref:Uncharacterized protein n=1 Tax=Mycolicibacterium brumae TaxID=85968 RepID=A0A2G5PFM1_9MYCO|nr:hypothetical protein [Mycolicibacterium brumae]MCV7194250.1 hypothetical protein [Mycolicibacterium brumae]PIB77102.1 hypothetical protein CQY22_002255 [Mycolicibacterium brumae]RWA19270.1 hypothetical protein MBRU_17075 [Mycolicibacterium brumae DSM 44177]UWW10437.1 hypothetical protein L2Z93_003567 [Mycolicibacterium brumae]
MAPTINADAVRYLELLGLPPPPPIPSDPVLAGTVLTEWWAQVLQLAANWGDPADLERAATEQAERDLKASDAAAKFPANEEASAQRMDAVTQGQSGSEFAQQIPQLISGLVGGITGGLGGLTQPLSQLPSQLGQFGQQLAEQVSGSAESPQGYDELLPEDLGSLGELGDLGDLGDLGLGGDEGSDGASPVGAAPTAMLGPPPAQSAATVPTSARSLPAVTPTASAPAPTTTPGVGGMPMMSPGPLASAAGSTPDGAPATKRVSAPAVRNGAPVQGRIDLPPSAPAVTKRVDGKVVATRRVVANPPSSPDA